MKRNQRLATAGVATLALLGVAGASIGWTAANASTLTTGASATRSHCGGTYGTAHGTRAPMDAAAKYLGLSRQELITQMHSGKTLTDIARTQGKSVVGLKAAMVTAMEQSLAADTTLTAAQRTAILALMKSHLEAMLTGKHMSGMDIDDMGSGMMGGTGNGMMGR